MLDVEGDAAVFGKPTTHKAYGETLAILAGDALQPEAFRLILEAPALSGERKLDAMRVLLNACGADGMVAGQVLDTLCPIENTEQLRHMEELKTGCMIAAAAELGCAASGMNAGMRDLAVQYAKDLGLAFQIRDDMLDVEGDAAVFGKPIGSDKEEGKFTFVDALGIEGCRAEVARLTEEAKSVVRHWADSDFLVTLADKLAGRVH